MPDNDSDRTEEATPRRKQKAIEEGNVPRSRELSTGITFLIAVLILYFYIPSMVEEFKTDFIRYFSMYNYRINKESAYLLLIEVIKSMAKVTLPLLFVLVFVAILANIVQFGVVFSSKVLELKWDRLNPISGFGRLFSKKSLFELLKSILKISLIGFAAFLIIKSKIPTILTLADADAVSSIHFLGKLIYEVSFKLAIIIMVIALIDFLYQRWQYYEDLKMTKQEVKEEFKQMEGDPLIKQRIRSMQREMARKRMMEEVPKADVVITNPTHYAVAIKYDMAKDRAPKVVAKGQRLIALKIREIASKNNVLIHEDPPLARTLYSSVEIGEEIPENLYKAVAEILAMVYRLKNKAV
ncbi:flagellar biosynthesis protein FlhB [Calditerrivibrio nitroreducens]|uniref:Flagellar biosynthetic protein FlhB n=1 Tax=Calditerrivibrio nitroreducens (strain DSM 19672 / NBRC 101217 / Yu37-1) TaxID=768670 RepID=E4TGI9_CALNY|nr:flagellar biosynthesis protein FlhB [Calditerrivibrio nitroreducens]ADR18670.1 flagellar biosynthetic protein FlhB [Calditerrivibrio nitroreducens DSM 19672]